MHVDVPPPCCVEMQISCSRSYFRQKTGYLLYIAWFAIMPNETSYSIRDICCACTRKTSHDVINCFIFELLASFTPVEPTHVIFACLFYVLVVVNLYKVMFIYQILLVLKAQNPQKTNRKKLIPLKVLPKKVLWYDLDDARIVAHHTMENSYVINDARESCIFFGYMVTFITGLKYGRSGQTCQLFNFVILGRDHFNVMLHYCKFAELQSSV